MPDNIPDEVNEIPSQFKDVEGAEGVLKFRASGRQPEFDKCPKHPDLPPEYYSLPLLDSRAGYCMYCIAKFWDQHIGRLPKRKETPDAGQVE